MQDITVNKFQKNFNRMLILKTNYLHALRTFKKYNVQLFEDSITIRDTLY